MKLLGMEVHVNDGVPRDTIALVPPEPLRRVGESDDEFMWRWAERVVMIRNVGGAE